MTRSACTAAADFPLRPSRCFPRTPLPPHALICPPFTVLTWCRPQVSALKEREETKICDKLKEDLKLLGDMTEKEIPVVKAPEVPPQMLSFSPSYGRNSRIEPCSVPTSVWAFAHLPLPFLTHGSTGRDKKPQRPLIDIPFFGAQPEVEIAAEAEDKDKEAGGDAAAAGGDAAAPPA